MPTGRHGRACRNATEHASGYRRAGTPARVAAGRRCEYPRAGARQLPRRGLARGAAILCASAQPFLADHGGAPRRAADRPAVHGATRANERARRRPVGHHRRLPPEGIRATPRSAMPSAAMSGASTASRIRLPSSASTAILRRPRNRCGGKPATRRCACRRRARLIRGRLPKSSRGWRALERWLP